MKKLRLTISAICSLLILAILHNNVFPQVKTVNYARGFPEITYSDELAGKFDSLAKAYYDAGLFNGTVLVAHQGKVLFSKGFGFANFQFKVPNDKNTVFDLASLSKQFTATAILILLDRGKLGLDDPVSIHFPVLTNPIYREITIKQLLNHTSGLADEPMVPVQSKKDINTRAELIAALNSMDLLFYPGEKFSYSNSGYNILALVIESLSGNTYSAFIQKEIFQPCGLTNSCFRASGEVIDNCAEGYGKILGKTIIENSDYSEIGLMGPGNLFSTVEDLLKWDQALYDYRIISKKSTGLMFTPYLSGYGFGWVLPSNLYINGEPQVVATHSGRGPGASTIIYRFLNEKLLVVVLSNVQGSQVQYLADNLVGIVADGVVRYPLPPFEDKLQEILFSKGIDSAKSAYLNAKAEGKFMMPNAGSINRLAYQFLRSGRIDEAIKVFELYIALYPLNSYAYDGYAEALYLDNQIEQSIKYYRKAIELNFDNVAARRVLKYLKIEDPFSITNLVLKEAIEKGPEAGVLKYQDLKESNDKPGEAYINTVAYTILRNKRNTDAGKLFELNTKIFPGSWMVWDSFAEYELLIGNKILAIEYFKKSLELNPNNDNAKKKLEELQK
jgi:CubicO group peptidase (beta-lactamase class C family)